MEARQKLREQRVLKPQKGNKNLYQIGDEVTLQNPHTQVWDIPAQITGIRTSPDGKILSYNLRQANGNQTTRHRVFIRSALPDSVVDGEAGGADTGLVEPDDRAETIDDPAEIIHEPVSSRLRPRARVAAIVEKPRDDIDELVENSPDPSNQELALSLTSKNSTSSHSVSAAILNSLVRKYHSVWKCSTMPGNNSCSCTCILAIYAGFATLLWVGLAAMVGHTSHTAVTCNPVIQDTQGSVEIINEETVNVDFFNSHTAERSEIKGDKKPVDADPCSQTCAHYFSSMEIGEMISFILLGYLIIANWGRISMWIHKKWVGIRKAAKEREMAREAARKDQEEERIRAEVEGRLELQRVAVVPSDHEQAGGSHQAPAIPVDLS